MHIIHEDASTALAWLILSGGLPGGWQDHDPEHPRGPCPSIQGFRPLSVRRTSGRKEGAMPQQEFLSQKVCETRDEAWLERASFAGVRIAHEHEEGVMVSGIAAETLPRDLRMRCMEALARYRAATGHEPAWLFIDSTEEKIVVR
jgi:hypothetical protein